jgi:anti-anti-sigma regulatory factor
MKISVNVQQAGALVAVLRIQGAINASNFVQVMDKAQEIYKNPAPNLIIDLSEVPSVSTTGLVAIHKIALLYSGVPAERSQRPYATPSGEARKHVRLLNPQPEVEKTLEKTGLKLYFKVFRDLESALNSF